MSHTADSFHCWQRGLEMLTRGAENSHRNPKNPPEKRLGGRVRLSLGMHSEESDIYLLVELSEPSLTHCSPPQPVPLTSHFPLLFFFFSKPTLMLLCCFPLPSIFIDRLFFMLSLWSVASFMPCATFQTPPDPCPLCCSPSNSKLKAHVLKMNV